MWTKNIKYSAYAIVNGECIAQRFFCSEQAKDNWCNKQGRKYGEDVTVEVRNFQTDAVIEHWHA